jgi:hypothetical protein
VQTAQPIPSGNKKTHIVGDWLPHITESEKLLERLWRSVENLRKKIARSVGPEKAILASRLGRAKRHAVAAQTLPEDVCLYRNARYEYRAIGHSLRQDHPKGTPPAGLYEYIRAAWSRAGKPPRGVQIRREDLEQHLMRSRAAVKRYLIKIGPFLIVEHGGKAHPVRYRPRLSEPYVLALQRPCL